MIIKQPTEFVLLEITPPAFLDRKLSSTSQLISAIHNLKLSHLSLEITSTKQTGIRFLIRVTTAKSDVIKNLLHAYLPEARVEQSDDYLETSDNNYVYDFYQTNHFAYPLHNFETNPDFDPISYITGVMTQLIDHQRISYQLLIKPTAVKEIPELQKRILRNEELSTILVKKSSLRTAKILDLVSKSLFGITDLITDSIHGPSHYSNYKQMRSIEDTSLINSRVKPARQLSNFETDLISSINNKISQPQYEVTIRVIFSNFNNDQINEKIANFKSAIGIYSVSGYQSLISHNTMIYQQEHKVNDRNIGQKSNILSLSEIASLYHFPHSMGAKTENVIKSLSKTLPAPVSLKNGTQLDILLGVNHYHGISTPIGLTSLERARHVYIIGGTGSGKTTTLLYGITQDINSGKGVAVLDPHGDLAESILNYIPENRIKDVIYLNPDDLSYPIGINLLELPEGVTGDDLLREKDLITESTISVLRKIFSNDDTGGHRVEYILRNTIQTALTLEGSTLFTIFKLLNDDRYRRKIIDGLKDEDLKNFWKNEIGKAGDFQKVKMSAGITAKIGRFLFSASAKRILEQKKSTIDFEDILDSGKILICNFSKGLLGEDTSTLFGTTILAKLQVAALRRARQDQTGRRPYYLYVDEFQNFATMSFVQMLSEARKYKLFLTMAEQSTSQQDKQRLVDIILANVGTVMCFRSGSPADERFILPLFSPYIDQGEIANLPAYNFYLRISGVKTYEPMSGETVVLSDRGSADIAKMIVESSRTNYSRKNTVVSKLIPNITSDTHSEPSEKEISQQLVSSSKFAE
jgi:hypothetical protein